MKVKRKRINLNKEKTLTVRGSKVNKALKTLTWPSEDKNRLDVRHNMCAHSVTNKSEVKPLLVKPCRTPSYFQSGEYTGECVQKAASNVVNYSLLSSAQIKGERLSIM